MTRFTLHVPVNDNSGVPIDGIARYVRDQLHQLSTGWTELDARGAWTMPNGDSIVEPMTLYMLDIGDSSADHVRGELYRIGRIIRSAIQQDAVYVTEQPIHSTFLR